MNNDNPITEIPDSLLLPIMKQFGVTREEAEKRMRLLLQSSILDNGHPDDPETQQLIDIFLSQDSDTAKINIQREVVINECVSSPEFVAQYDRLTKRDFARVLKSISDGKPSKNAMYEFGRFAKFVDETVVSRFERELK